jgi:hypothetical protein
VNLAQLMKFLEAEVVTEEAVLAIEVLVAFLFLYYAGSPEVGPAGVIAEAGYTGSAEAGLGLIAVEAAAGLAEAAEISEVAEVAEIAAEVAAEVAEVAAEVAAAEAEPAGLVEPLAEPEPEA